MSSDHDEFTDDDLAYFSYQAEQARLAQPVIERDYATLTGTRGAWVVFRDGQL